ncbi:Hypothetical predicted protein [Paramuricea clavata]|uniref:Uncharacterized protein n=2 Tax=Paramuricea clavata TaxID=317549 RepID=A0A7D9E5R9_PARCT|nr:Hypothetical predicted protein [Paramuricea clavata]
MTEVSDLKHNLCEKQAKIESLESELATLKGNYKTDSESTRNKPESIDIKLTGQGESIIELKQSTQKICKKIDNLKKYANSNINDAERSFKNIQNQSNATNQNLDNDRPMAINIESEDPNDNSNDNRSEITFAAVVKQKANHSLESNTKRSGSENTIISLEHGLTNQNQSEVNNNQQIVLDDNTNSEFVGVARRVVKRLYLG